jgi:tRNA threonylcarbamoyladenosine biosynthesis protein TsaB
MSCVLAIDSSGRGGSLALARAGNLLACRDHDPALGYAEELFGLLEAVLGDARLPAAQIDAVAVVRGPGSFTGLRIGVMTAKSLAWAWRIPLFAAGTLELLVCAARRRGFERAIAAQEAGADHVYAAAFEFSAGPLRRWGPERLSMGQLAERLEREHSDDGPIAFVPWGSTCRAALAAADVGSARRLVDAAPLASQLALGASRGEWPAERADPVRLVPLYVSRSQAERVHDLDLHERVHRPVPPQVWE